MQKATNDSPNDTDGGPSESRAFNSSIAIERGNAVLAVVSLLVGGYLGQLIPPLVDKPGDPQYWPLWLLVCACVLLVAGVGAFVVLVRGMTNEASASSQKVTAQATRMERSNSAIISLVEQSVARQAALIPRDYVYKEMARAFDHAQQSISVVTLLAVDWETGERNWLPAKEDTPFRGEFYNAVKRAIANDRVAYERIWQVPAEKRELAFAALFSDPVHREEFELIEAQRNDSPHLAKFMIASTITTASFILIDGKQLFFNIDLYNDETRQLESPYMLFIKDATGDAFKPLNGVIARFKPLVDNSSGRALIAGASTGTGASAVPQPLRSGD